jgi:uncharacterized membrane protein YoaK (UPF0700 family)
VSGAISGQGGGSAGGPIARASAADPLLPALLVLTVATGIVDAISFLGLGHVFVANMTGNVVFLGFGLAGAAGISVHASLVAILAFAAGAVVGGRLAARDADRPRRLLLVALALEAALVIVAIPLSIGVSGGGASARGDVVIAVLAVAMGIRNAAVRRLRVPDITTTILTMTLTGLVAESPLGRGSGARQGRRAGALVGMFLGALVGGLLVVHDHRLAALALLAAVLVMCLVVAVLHPGLRRPGVLEA